MLQSSLFGIGEGGLRSSLPKITGQLVVDTHARIKKTKHVPRNGAVKQEKCTKEDVLNWVETLEPITSFFHEAL